MPHYLETRLLVWLFMGYNLGVISDRDPTNLEVKKGRSLELALTLGMVSSNFPPYLVEECVELILCTVRRSEV